MIMKLASFIMCRHEDELCIIITQHLDASLNSIAIWSVLIISLNKTLT